MVQTKTFQIRFERNLDRIMPSSARSILHRVARDVTRSIKKTGSVEQHLGFGHATLHMKLYQRFGIRANDFTSHAHQALDELVNEKLTSNISLPLEFGATS